MRASLLVLQVVLLAVMLVSVGVVLYQLVKQQGRLLLRLDAVERQLARVAEGAVLPPAALNGERSGPQGLAVGTAFSPFRLPDLTGRLVSLEDFRGKRVVLIHWSPDCGFCDLIAPELRSLQGELAERNAQILLVSHGDAESNRKLAVEYALDSPILLLAGSEHPIEAFQSLGTPAAYLLDEMGRIAAPLALGADQVPALARAAAAAPPRNGRLQGRRLPGERPLAESRIERDGLKAGTPAPVFRLPDVYGRPVSLEEYRGRRVLLVFTDPQCGPCEDLAPQLARLDRQHRGNGLALMMVGRGGADENRRNAEQHGVEFPVVLQERWKLSKEYGIFATPVAFLIDEEGVIARRVAKGVDEILALARTELAAEGAREPKAAREAR